MTNTDQKISEIIKICKEKLDYADAKTKKEINAQFNLSGSKKTAQIEHELLGIADNYRKDKTCNFTQNDYYVWNKFWNFPASKAKIAEAMKCEHMGWVQFVLGIFKQSYNKTKGMCHEDKRYLRLLEIINDNSSETQLAKSKINEICEKLTVLTLPFKEKHYERFINSEKHKFDYYKNFSEQIKTNQERLHIRQTMPSTYAQYVTIKSKSKDFDWNVYKKLIDKDFENTFARNIKAIAIRIDDKNISPDNLKILSVEEDPQFFEMMLKDNADNLIHCRSIIAAEFSVLMQTHYRFIVTIKSKKK